MFGLTERAAGVHSDVRVETPANSSDGGECSANFERKTRKNQLPSAGRFDSVCDPRIIESVDRGTVDDLHLRQSFDQFRNCWSPHAVPGRCRHDNREFERLRRLGKADDIMLELCDRVVTHPAHEADLVINEDERSVFGCERLVNVAWVGHDILPSPEICDGGGWCDANIDEG